MKKLLRLGLFGFISWLVIFGASVCLFALKKDDQSFFEILMSYVLTTVTVTLSILYLGKIKTDILKESCLLGLAFVVCNILIDLPLFSNGPMRMPMENYFKNIGLAYLSMPIITIGFGCLLHLHRRTT